MDLEYQVQSSLVVAELTRDDHVVAAGTDRLVLAQLRGTDDCFTDMQELAIPPHLFSWAAAAHACAQTLDELLAIHFPLIPCRPANASGEHKVCQTRPLSHLQ